MLGERVGNYVIKQLLGEGGMGEVYLAEHPTIGKRVALKVLHSELSSKEEVVTRFFHEAKAVNDIGHPNIVDIQDYGTLDSARGPVVYLVMELLQGKTLTQVIRATPQLDERRAVRITHQIADALAASHERGIIHRDLKPDNVMLITRGRDEDFVKLLDFGIAKVKGTMSKTRTGMVIGTPAYMSPEQCEGRPTIDHRTDIYALGIVLYEMLTGRVPFIGESYGELLVKHIMEAPPPPTTLRAGLTPHLEMVILRALMKQPADRFESMRELANALGDPQQYVESHGGLSGFLPAAPGPKQPTAPHVAMARGTVVPAASTTLTQSAGQRPTGEVPAPGKSKAPLAIAFAAVAAVGIAITIAATMGGSKDKKAEVAVPTAAPVATPAGSPSPTTAPTPPPITAPTTATTPTTTPTTTVATPTPAATTVKLSVTTTPAKASVYLAGETKPRCKSPCSFDVTRGEGETKLVIKLSGYADATKSVSIAADANLDVALVKRASGTRPTTRPNGPVGDNTLNPFEQ
jgi:eukaryotic-like serine/threonine-protein kinase